MSTATTSTPTQPPLLPTLYALVSPSQYQQVVAAISLRAIHAQPYASHDKLYLNANPVIPGQMRTLRLRGTHGPIFSPASTRAEKKENGEVDGASKSGGKEKEEKGGKGKEKEKEDLSLAYISAPLSGREYADATVRAIVELDIRGLDERDQVEDFISTLGFAFSHEYNRSGTIFHLPLPHPTLHLHLTITRLTLPTDPPLPPQSPSSTAPVAQSSEPWLVQLHPSKPIPGVASRGDFGLSEVIDYMRTTAERIDGVEWGTGRPA